MDVACKIVIDHLAYMRAKGLPVEPLLVQLHERTSFKHEMALLEDARYRIPWDLYVDFLEIWQQAVGGPAGERDFIQQSWRNAAEWTRVMSSVARHLASPQQIFFVVVRWGGPSMFANILAAMQTLPDERLEISLALQPENRSSDAFFRLCSTAFADLLPQLGFGHADVTCEIGPRSGRYFVTLPQSESLAKRVSRRVKGFFSVGKLLEEISRRDDESRASLRQLQQSRLELEAEVQRRTAELEASNTQLKEHIESLRQVERLAHVGTWSINATSREVVWSDETYRIFGVLPVGCPIAPQQIISLVHPDDREALRIELEHSLQTGAPFSQSYRIGSADGAVRFARANAVVGLSPDGKPTHLSGTVQDLTRQHHYEQSLIAAKEAADQANRTKTTFLASMSHEIRTPMTSVLGFADLLGRGDHPLSVRQAYVEKIMRNGHHLLTLIDDILDLSRIETGHLMIQPTRFAPAAEITHVIELVRGQADAKSLTLNVVREAPFPETMLSDQVRFRQILLNLLINAIKYTDLGEVTLTARQITPAGRPLLEVMVEDTGVGIAPQYREALFQPFSRGSDSDLPLRGGSGLGLALARNLARALGGEVELVTSRPGGGSTFRTTVDLNLQTDLHNSELGLPLGGGFALRVSAGGHVDGLPVGTRIMVVEDNADIQEIIRRVLEGIGAEVVMAFDGDACLKLAGEQDFDLVMMDMQMPIMDGFEATRQLRSRGFQKPIIAISASAMVSERERQAAAGCDDFLAKPVEALALVRTVGKWVGRAKATEAPSVP